MKHKGSTSYYKEEMTQDLLRAYREQMAISKGDISLPEIARRIAQSPCRRFWVTEERVGIVINAQLRGEKAIEGMKTGTTREMYQEIYRRFIQYREEHPSLTKKEIIFHVCNEPAPKFYRTPESIIIMLHKARKEEKRRCLEQRKKRLGFMFSMP